MSQEIGRASEADLGGKKLARRFASRIAKARTLAGAPTSTRRLKKVARQLKAFSAQLAKALGAAKVKADLGAILSDLASQTSSELSGLITGG